MTVSTNDILRSMYNVEKAAGRPSINSDATMEIEGYPNLRVLTKQFPWPTVGPAGEIEVPGQLGTISYIPQQAKTGQQGPIAFKETQDGQVMAFMESILLVGGIFNGTVYEGTPDRFVRAYKIRDCFFVPDQPDRDFENRTQIMLLNGTLFFHFYGERIPGNITAL